MKTVVKERLDCVARVLPAIAHRATEWVSLGARFAEDGALLIGPDPTVAPEYYRIRLFPPAPEKWIEVFESRYSIPLPAEYKRVLMLVNGCSFFGLDLFGVSDSEMVDRKRQMPLQLAHAVSYWAAEYGRPGAFHFGAADWTDEMGCGYFWSGEGPCAVLSSGRVLRTWHSIRELVADEVARLRDLSS